MSVSDDEQPLVVRLGPRVSAADVERVCARAEDLMRGNDAQIVRCDVRETAADAALVDVLARINLVARRHGCGTEVLSSDEALWSLLELAGLRSLFRRA